VSALQASLAAFGDAQSCAGLRERLCLQAFAPVATDDYRLMTVWDAEARAAGYDAPG
jgi:hypothetical protein